MTTSLELGGSLYQSLTKSIELKDSEQLDAIVSEWTEQELFDGIVFLTNRTKNVKVLVGRLAYELRTKIGDGDWGPKVYELAAACNVSTRTIHRWMRSYQDEFSLELTPSQIAAESAILPDAVSSEPDDTDIFAAFEEEDWDADSEGFAEALDGTPPAGENSLTGVVKPRANHAIPPDEIWMAFTKTQISAEFPGYDDSALGKLAESRWVRFRKEKPQELLDTLNEIYEMKGEELPQYLDEGLTAIIHEKEEEVLSGEVVNKPKKAKKVKTFMDQATDALASVRQIHVRVVDEENPVTDEELASIKVVVQGLQRVVTSLDEKVSAAKKRVALQNQPSEVDL